MNRPAAHCDSDSRQSFFRILLVDDFAPWRQSVRSMLEKRAGLQIVGEASDGEEALQKTQELRPDLVLMDGGLPILNGIEAARRIRKFSSETKILFLTQESSAEMVQEALRLGAVGYLVKKDAASELLAAVETVRQGGRFVSRVLSGDNVTAAIERIPDLCQENAPRSLMPEKARIDRSHKVQFWSDDASLLLGFTRFIVAALKAGNAVVAITTELHRIPLSQKLQAQDLDVGAAIEHGRFIHLDVAETLSTFMVNDLPDPIRFWQVTGDLVAAAAKAAIGERPRVVACGEIAPTLWGQGKAEAAIQVEHLWDETARIYDVDVFCGYVLKSFQREQENHIFQRICAEHSAVCS